MPLTHRPPRSSFLDPPTPPVGRLSRRRLPLRGADRHGGPVLHEPGGGHLALHPGADAGDHDARAPRRGTTGGSPKGTRGEKPEKPEAPSWRGRGKRGVKGARALFLFFLFLFFFFFSFLALCACEGS